MKVVKLSHPNYEYDVHSLVKAFYAEDQVTVITPETKPEKLAELEPQASLEIELGETGAKIRVGEEDFLWYAASETIADGYKNGLKRFLCRQDGRAGGCGYPQVLRHLRCHRRGEGCHGRYAGTDIEGADNGNHRGARSVQHH